MRPAPVGAGFHHSEYVDGRFVMVEDVVAEGETPRNPAIRITENWYEEFRNREQD